MEMTLSRRWWVVALRGVAAIAFGILTFVSPQSSLFALVVLFGAYALVDGAFNLAMLARGPRGTHRWTSMIVHGVISMVAGALTLLWPGISAMVLLMLIAAWAVVHGIFELVTAVRLRKQIQGEWLLALSGILSVAFGVLLFLFPGAGALALILWIGAYALVTGVLLLILGFKLRGIAQRTAGPKETAAPPPTTAAPTTAPPAPA